jgi:hypothetical protein
MKTKFRKKKFHRKFPKKSAIGPCLVGASLIVGAAARAADAITPDQVYEGGTNTYKNWIELSTGGMMTSGFGNGAQQREQLNKNTAFGGIEDLHYEQDVGTNHTTFALDGRSIYDNHDYKVGLSLKRENLGYLLLKFENFRVWDSGEGGFSPPDGIAYSLPGDGRTLDRGQVSFEAGLTKKDIPKIVFKYTHRYREGEKSSTSWGPSHTADGTRGLYPGFYALDETADIFQLDVTHRIKKTDFGVGASYEKGSINDAHDLTFFPGEAIQQRATDREGSSYDMVSAHAFTETWLKQNLFFSTGFLFANLDETMTGSRIYGDDFDAGYTPGFPLGYFDLNGSAHQHEYTGNINLLAQPAKNFTIVPSLRVQKKDWDAHATGTGTLDTFGTQAFVSDGSSCDLEVRERLEMQYKGVTNWVFSAGGEWTEGQQDLHESGGLTQIAGFGPPPVLLDSDNTRFYQKYFANARWYPMRQVTVDAGGYYKINRYDYSFGQDSTPNDLSTGDAYPGFIVYQGFETYDGNLRLTLRPIQNVTLVSRYEYQLSTVDTRPDAASGLGQVESSRMNSHVIAQNANWTPLNWLSLQAGFNYVLSTTKTPVTDYTQAVVNSQNNYWTVNFNAGLVLDQKTDLNLGYFYYRADDYQNIFANGVPYGAGATEHSATASLTRRLNEHVRLNLRYAFTHYEDTPSFGRFNFDAHVIFASMQYRF